MAAMVIRSSEPDRSKGEKNTVLRWTFERRILIIYELEKSYKKLFLIYYMSGTLRKLTSL